jgi:hypothetical protein
MASEDYQRGFDLAGEWALFSLAVVCPYPNPATDFERGWNAGLAGLACLITPHDKAGHDDVG